MVPNQVGAHRPIIDFCEAVISPTKSKATLLILNYNKAEYSRSSTLLTLNPKPLVGRPWSRYAFFPSSGAE